MARRARPEPAVFDRARLVGAREKCEKSRHFPLDARAACPDAARRLRAFPVGAAGAKQFHPQRYGFMTNTGLTGTTGLIVGALVLFAIFFFFIR